MIEHNDVLIPGTHGSPVFTAPELQSVRTKFFGVKGESEILGETGARIIQIAIRLHNKLTDSQSLMDLLDELDQRVGQHGDLVITRAGAGSAWPGGIPRTFRHCTFEGFAKESGDQSGPLPDYVGLLDGTTPSWWVMGMLQFRQLRAGSDG